MTNNTTINTIDISDKMGSSASVQAANVDAFAEWIAERAWTDTHYTTDFRHLTYGERSMIDMTIARAMATNRRIETKLLELGKDDYHVLDALVWD